MSLIPWKPFGEIDDFFGDENWFPLVRPGTLKTEPVMDIYETEKEIVAEVNLPGVEPEKIDISVKDQILEVSGSSEDKKEEKKKGYWRKEIRKGTFRRAVRLSAPVKEDKIEAVYDKGVLKIVMPKSKKKGKEKKIKIKIKK